MSEKGILHGVYRLYIQYQYRMIKSRLMIILPPIPLTAAIRSRQYSNRGSGLVTIIHTYIRYNRSKLPERTSSCSLPFPPTHTPRVATPTYLHQCPHPLPVRKHRYPSIHPSIHSTTRRCLLRIPPATPQPTHPSVSYPPEGGEIFWLVRLCVCVCVCVGRVVRKGGLYLVRA